MRVPESLELLTKSGPEDGVLYGSVDVVERCRCSRGIFLYGTEYSVPSPMADAPPIDDEPDRPVPSTTCLLAIIHPSIHPIHSFIPILCLIHL